MNKKLLTLLCLMAVFAIILFRFYPDSLTRKLKRLADNSQARISVAVIRGEQNWSIEQESRPLLSVFKFPIALCTLRALENADAGLDTQLRISGEMLDFNTWSPMLKKHPPFSITVADLLRYMVSESDNNAADILLAYGGGIPALNRCLAEAGFPGISIKVNEKTMNENIKTQYQNTARPSDIVRLIKYARESNFLSAQSRRFLDRIMLETATGADKLKAGLPPQTPLGHKTGSSSRLPDGLKIADNDAGFVRLPDGSFYYIAVFVSDSRLSDAENAAIIAAISRTVYDSFK